MTRFRRGAIEDWGVEVRTVSNFLEGIIDWSLLFHTSHHWGRYGLLISSNNRGEIAEYRAFPPAFSNGYGIWRSPCMGGFGPHPTRLEDSEAQSTLSSSIGFLFSPTSNFHIEGVFRYLQEGWPQLGAECNDLGRREWGSWPSSCARCSQSTGGMPISWTEPHRAEFFEREIPSCQPRNWQVFCRLLLNNAHVSGRYLGQVFPILCSHPVKRSRQLSSGSGFETAETLLRNSVLELFSFGKAFSRLDQF